MNRSKSFQLGIVCLFVLLLLLIGWWQAITASPASLTANAAGATPTSALLYMPSILRFPTPVPTGPEWLQYVNRFRMESGLPLLDENTSWSAGGVLHSRYMVKNDVITHNEDPGNVWYTPEGAAAGENGNVMVSSWVDAPDELAVDFWMTGPFHAIAIIDPKLETTGFGSYRESDGGWQFGATLDVSRGRGDVPTGLIFPIFFPGANGQMWLTSYTGGEWPDPLSSCAGYSAPTGPPLMIQMGPGNFTPAVTNTTFLQGSTPLPHCSFDETNYVNGDGGTQSIGRSILNSRDAIVIMPRDPLVVGETYSASITTHSSTFSWSFTVVSPPTAMPDIPFEAESR